MYHLKFLLSFFLYCGVKYDLGILWNSHLYDDFPETNQVQLH